MFISFSFLIFLFLIIAIVGGLAIRKTRLPSAILLGSVLVLLFLGVVLWRFTFTPSHSQDMEVWNDSTVRLSTDNYSGAAAVAEAPAEQAINELTKRVVEPINHLSQNDQVQSIQSLDYQDMPAAAASTRGYIDHASLKLRWLLVIGLLLAGGLALIISMLFHSKTRSFGIALLVAGPILLLLIAAGIYSESTYRGAPKIVNLTAHNGSTTASVSTSPPIPVPQAPSIQFANSIPVIPSPPVVASPDSKQVIHSYEAIINNFSKTLAQPLKMETNEILSDKNSTLRITVRDIGQVTISGSSLLINTIGQALAKAMTERMKENNTQLEVTPDKSPISKEAAATEIARENPSPAQPAATNKLSSRGSSADNKSPPSDKRPDWVDKPSRRVGDSYQISLTTEPYTTRLECEAKIPYVLQSAVDQFVEAYLGQQWKGWVQLQPEQLRQLVADEWEETKDYSVGKMTQIHLLVSFDQKAKELISETLNFRRFTGRAAVAGTGLVGVWLLLAAIWGYLKIDLTTKGAYRKRLRFAAGSAILLIVAMIMIVLRSLA